MRFVLVETSHPGNVGAAARAMRVMGLTDLVLVAPRLPDAARHPDAIAFASGASDILARSRVVPDLDAALADVGLAIAVSAATRAFGPEPLEPGAAALLACDELARNTHAPVAFVFGTERTGLLITHVQRCQALTSIPGAPDYNSLNLAQAVQIVAWELRKATLAYEGQAADAHATDAHAADAQAADASAHVYARQGAPADMPERRGVRADRNVRMAAGEQIEHLFTHLEQALIAVRFLDPKHPKKLMPRLRRLFSRTRLEVEEVELLRGMCKQMLLAAQHRLPPHPPPSATTGSGTGDPADPATDALRGVSR